ncbi:protein phosphatase 2C domain-containing protein [Prochlorothrix hollandica]|uniref:PPM-type phosphatase domain-containing protein n=1 Tax=Prochlorothrix hollandica PCC 9006 = CALU 1027 TaxID=317619 RepID=A0A0M2PWH7_PROHO|nr:protein phosphatase 2C domain-containing protein [Prochlorothrix hollandica]KKI99437.1 hypothetical protein PROH_12565 [Prochlorothrix hollandica PCC 9006 = CALU 1027]
MNPAPPSPSVSPPPLPFQIAGGSVVGREHRRLGKNNQDAYGWRVMEGAIAAVVCDGCGSTPHSEVGANLGVRLLLQGLGQRYQRGEDPTTPAFWQGLRRDLLDHLQTLAQTLDDAWQRVIRDYFLFTIAGAYITPQTTVLFALGDSLTVLNSHCFPAHSYPHNSPPYLAYGLLSTPFSEAELQIQLLQTLPTDQVQSLLLGTDGVSDLIRAELAQFPGQDNVIGSLGQFWQDDRYFKNPDQVRRQLSLINRELTTAHWETQQLTKTTGLLPDDTTLIVLRR